MAVLENLEPKRVFGFFEEMSAIPHGSGNTRAISEWLVSFAKERSLEVHQDQMGNVIIIKEATPGYEGAEPFIIQGHMDMVCETAPDCAKDMAREGLDLAVDGDLIYAKGTTLGGDDGIAVAMALAILDADDLQHPRVEVIVTVDEEIGLLGAAGIDVAPLKGRRMLNVDSEMEGVFTVSCAGGSVGKCVLPVAREAFEGSVVTVKVGGLQGGHSGVEIDKGRGNANLLMGRVLFALSKATGLRLVSVNGGRKDNVITAENVAVLTVSDLAAAREVCARMDQLLKNEYCVTDPGVTVTLEETSSELLPMDQSSTDRVLCFLTCAPNGIQAMSADIAGLVQTSLNLGVLVTDEAQVAASFGIRSSVSSQIEMMADRLDSLTRQLGGTLTLSGTYPGWAYRQDSPLRDMLVEIFTQQYGRAPKVEAVHAGLECGMFAGKIADLDCVSIGPDLFEIHSCRERMSISSVQRVWAMIVELLRRMK